MGTTSDKLTYLNTSKGKIKDVINMTGANITSDTTFRNYATKLYDGYVNVLKDKNTLLDNMPKGTSTSYITDAANLPVYEDKMNKESSQETTTGVQLANIDDYSTTKLGVNVSCINNEFVLNGINSVGSLIGSGGSSGHLYMATLPAGTYTFSFKKISGSLTYSSGSSAFYIRKSDGQSIKGLNITSTTNNTTTIFSLSEETSVYLEYYVNTSNWEFTNYDFQIMILSGNYTSSIIPDFENYTGGQPSPSPELPQNVKTVKGYRNLFDKDNVDWYRNNDSIFDNKTNNSSTRIRTSSFEIQGGKTYKISGYPNTVSLLLIRTYNNEQTGLGAVSISNDIFTLNSDVSYIHLLFGGTNFTDETNILMKNANIQIIEGTEELPYVPYGTNYVAITNTNGTDTNYYTIPLNGNEIAGIGTYKDELIIDKNGKCWLNKKIPKKIFTENDNWVRQSVYTNNTRYVLNDNNVVAKLGTQILSNYFLKGKGGTDTVNIDVNGGTGWLMITIPNTIAPTLVDFNNWLQTKYNEDNPVYALYVTTTSQLIDLNYTVDIELFKGINNISNSDDMDMEIKYIKEAYE